MSRRPTRHERIAAALARFEVRHGRRPAVLDWDSRLRLAARFRTDRVFSPPDDSPTLPYVDRSIDVVVCRRTSRALAEARRVAAAMVITTAATGRASSIRVESIGPKPRSTPAVTPRRARRRGGERHALVCTYHAPQLDRDSGARRIFHFLEFLQDAGWRVSFLASDGVGDPRDASVLRQRGVQVYDGVTDRIEDILGNRHVDLALIAFWSNGERYLPLIRATSPSTRVVVDSVDLHFLRDARRLFLSGASGRLDGKFASRLVRELNVYASADGVLTVSSKEADLIGDLTADPTLAQVVPDCERQSPAPAAFSARRGILSLGSFEHPPNVEALQYLCEAVLPRLDASLLAAHPVQVVGNAPTDRIRQMCRSLPHVRLVGWVPAVDPYFERTRISVIPLRYGAGTKRKMVQALMTGTPTVSTSIGIEGLDLQDGEHVLVADDPETFAASITRLLTDAALWRRIARQGRAHIAKTHTPLVARTRLIQAIDRALARDAKRPVPSRDEGAHLEHSAADRYRSQLVPRIRDIVSRALPSDATIAVVSKGDEQLTTLNGRRGWHFPRRDDGVYAGHYPATSVEAIEHLETLRAQGAGFLLFPATALWWLRHYTELTSHLDTRYRVVVDERDVCVIYDLESTAPRVDVAPPPEPPTASPVGVGDVKLIAWYLPQFHPIPENDAWWGEGFTEWRNVAKTDPLFPSHYQPHLPGDLGFYDLRLAETRAAQADLARSYGIHGFCYYHYWFNGKRLLERPFDEVLASGTPDFPFCLCWANDPWSRRWNGLEDDLLQAQTYSAADDLRHIRWLVSALRDPRAIRVEGKPIFLVYRAKHLPDAARTTDIWRKEVDKAGLPGVYLIAVETAWDLGWDATRLGFDAKVLFQPQFGKLITAVPGMKIPGRPELRVYNYQEAWEVLGNLEPVSYRRYESVFPCWDNSPRVGETAFVLHDSTPAAFEGTLRRAIARARRQPVDHRIVFINAWNEWAEGCHLEPDLAHGSAYLEATRHALQAV